MANEYNKSLCRSIVNRRLGGVCGGFAEYFGWNDPTWLRLAWAFSVFFAGAGLLLYIICWVVMPEDPKLIQR